VVAIEALEERRRAAEFFPADFAVLFLSSRLTIASQEGSLRPAPGARAAGLSGPVPEPRDRRCFRC